MFVTLVYLEKDLTLNLQVQSDLTLENFRAICSVEVSIPSDQLVLVHNGKPLPGDSSTLDSHNVKENDVIAVHPKSSSLEMQGRPPGMPRIDFGAIRVSRAVDIFTPYLYFLTVSIRSPNHGLL